MDCPGQMQRGREIGGLLHLLCYYNTQKKNYNIYFKIIKIIFNILTFSIVHDIMMTTKACVVENDVQLRRF